MGKYIEMKCRLVVARGWEKGKWLENWLMGKKFPFKVMERFWNYIDVMVNKTVNVLSATQWPTVRWLFFLTFFFMWTTFKVFIEFVPMLLLLYVLVFWLQGMWDLSSPTRD